MTNTASIGAKLGIAFDLQWRDKDGNVLKTVQCNGSVPLADTGLTLEQAQALIDQQEPKNGNHSSERG